MNRKGQIGIWVIMALALVGGIILFFALEKGPSIVGETVTEPNQFIEKCVGDAVNEVVDKILPQGGFLNPTNYKVYNYTNISYICENTGYYKPCYNLHPALVEDMSGEIKTYITPRVEQCFENLKTESEKRDASVELGEAKEISVSMASDKILVNIPRAVSITEKETTRSFDKFNADIGSPAYNLASVAMAIANSQAAFCNFDYASYMMGYPRFDIRAVQTIDPTKIYRIRDKESGKVMNIAIRSCALTNAGTTV